LPGDLPKRYSELGEKFASSYLRCHEGGEIAGLAVYDEMLELADNDIILYEKGVVLHRLGKTDECEHLFRRSISLNPSNPLSHLGLVQLLAEKEQYNEALTVIDSMIENSILSDQSLLMKGDILQQMGQQEQALQIFSIALQSQASAKMAAERMIHLLEEDGRSEEAEYLYKKYLKGCC
jgi:Tfp pilus assembly protein PilF